MVVTSPLPGRIISFKVKMGEEVAEDQPLFVMEALKMENVVSATESGVISSIYVNAGDDVDTGDRIMEIS